MWQPHYRIEYEPKLMDMHKNRNICFSWPGVNLSRTTKSDIFLLLYSIPFISSSFFLHHFFLPFLQFSYIFYSSNRLNFKESSRAENRIDFCISHFNEGCIMKLSHLTKFLSPCHHYNGNCCSQVLFQAWNFPPTVLSTNFS
jgi:hypothetical protein